MPEEKYQKEKDDLQNQIIDLRDNHIAHLADDITEIKIKLAGHSEALIWIKKVMAIVATATVGSLIASLMNLL